MNEKQLPTEQTNTTESSFPTGGDLLLLLGAYLLFAAIIPSLSFALNALNLELSYAGVEVLLINLTLLSLTILFFEWYRRRREAPRPTIYWRLKKPHLMTISAALGATFTSGIVFEPLLSLLPDVDQQITLSVWMLLSTVVVAPVCEEYLCRGLLFGSLLRRYGAAPAVLLSALIFGAMHVLPLPAVNAFIIGILLAMSYLATRSLWVPVLIHAANNLAAMLLYSAAPEEDQLSLLLADRPALYWAIYAASFILFACSLLQLIRASRKASTEW